MGARRRVLRHEQVPGGVPLSQEKLLLDLFREKGTLTTADFGHHPQLWAEYRRALTGLRHKGYTVSVTRMTKNLFEYRLVSPPPPALPPAGIPHPRPGLVSPRSLAGASFVSEGNGDRHRT